VIDNGETGFLLKSGDASDLDTKLQLLIGDPLLRNRIGKAAARPCEDRFNVTVSCARSSKSWTTSVRRSSPGHVSQVVYDDDLVIHRHQPGGCQLRRQPPSLRWRPLAQSSATRH